MKEQIDSFLSALDLSKNTIDAYRYALERFAYIVGEDAPLTVDTFGSFFPPSKITPLPQNKFGVQQWLGYTPSTDRAIWQKSRGFSASPASKANAWSTSTVTLWKKSSNIAVT